MQLRCRRVLLSMLAGAAVAAASLAAAPHVRAATGFVVTTASDPASGTACPATGSSPCSLRAAVEAANAAGGTVSITFAVAGPFVLSQGELAVTGGETLTIQGAAGGATVIDAANKSRAIWVSNLSSEIPCGPAASSLSLADIAVVNGTVPFNSPGDDGFGGGIDVNCASSLSLFDSSVSGSTAPNGGGGIDDNTTGTVTLLHSTVSGNTAQGTNAADGGGGIALNTAAKLAIVDSTVSGNSAATNGGAIYAVSGATLGLADDTIANNSATGTATGGVVALVNASASAVNTIIARNANANCSGTITDGGHNLEDGTSCGFSTSAVNADPRLGPLQASNGGPTATMSLLPGSPAIAAGDDTVCKAAPDASSPGAGGVDQRGAIRPQAAHCDIGAFEVVSTTTSLSAPSTAVPGASVTLNATVTPRQALPGAVTGTVTFLDGTAVLGTASLSSVSPATAPRATPAPSTASMTTSSLTAGTHTLTARFEQTPLFLSSTSAAVTLVVAAPAAPIAPPNAGGAPPWRGGGLLMLLGGALGIGSRRLRRR